VKVTCVSHEEDSGYRLRAPTTCTKSKQTWQCRACTVAWSIPLGPNNVDVKVTRLVLADQATEIVRYAASIRDFQRIPVSAIISGFCNLESDGNSSWLLHRTGLTLAIVRDCLPAAAVTAHLPQIASYSSTSVRYGFTDLFSAARASYVVLTLATGAVCLKSRGSFVVRRAGRHISYRYRCNSRVAYSRPEAAKGPRSTKSVALSANGRGSSCQPRSRL
jgi:hypothetical protein